MVATQHAYDYSNFFHDNNSCPEHLCAESIGKRPGTLSIINPFQTLQLSLCASAVISVASRRQSWRPGDIIAGLEWQRSQWRHVVYVTKTCLASITDTMVSLRDVNQT